MAARFVPTSRLSNIIQMIMLSRQSGILRAIRGQEAARQMGQIRFASGQPASVLFGQMVGENALNALMGWGECMYSFDEFAAEGSEADGYYSSGEGIPRTSTLLRLPPPVRGHHTGILPARTTPHLHPHNTRRIQWVHRIHHMGMAIRNPRPIEQATRAARCTEYGISPGSHPPNTGYPQSAPNTGYPQPTPNSGYPGGPMPDPNDPYYRQTQTGSTATSLPGRASAPPRMLESVPYQTGISEPIEQLPLDRRERMILLLVNGQRSMLDLVRLTHRTEREIYSVLHHLALLGLIQFRR